MFYSQVKQDEILENNIFKGFQNGFFVDIGAHDGVTINNTLFFEKERGWKGINVEPIPDIYKKLVENRPNCVNLKYAVCNKEGISDFLLNKGYTEMLSGLKDTFDQRHLQRLERENKETSSTTELIQVETKRFESICDEYNVRHIHYLSIDVEGAESDVIQSINFDKVFIDVIGFENNFEDTSLPIITYLMLKGYNLIISYSDVLMIHKNSEFFKTCTLKTFSYTDFA